MTANQSKFQSLIVGKNNSNFNEFQINDKFKINVSNEITLLGIHFDKQPKFDSHVDKICNKAAMYLNAIKRPARFMGSKERSNCEFIYTLSFQLLPSNPVTLQQRKSTETRENQ